MEKIPINIPDFEEDSNEVSTQVDIPNSNDYLILTLRYMLDGFFSYQIDYYRLNRSPITINMPILAAQYGLIPYPVYKLLIPYNIQCTTTHGQKPQGKHSFQLDTKFFLYKNEDYVNDILF